MSEPTAVRNGASAAVAPLAEALAARLGPIEVVVIDGDAAAHREALRRGEVDVLARAADDVATPTDGVELVAVPRRTTATLPPAEWLDAPAPEAILLELPVDADAALRRRVAKLDHAPTRLLVEAERAVLAAGAPEGAAHVAVRAMLEDGLLFLTATSYGADGVALRTSSHAIYPEDAADPGAELAARVVAELSAAPRAD